MSLVNDLLIEIDRNRGDASRSDVNPLEGLSPRKPKPTEAKPRVSRIPKLIAFAATGAIGFGVAQLLPTESADPGSAVSDGISLVAESVTNDLAGEARALPRVSAPRPPETLNRSPVADLARRIAGETPEQDALFGRDHRVDRPVALRAVRVEQSGSATRVEIAMDREAQFRIEPGANEGVFDVVLEEATVREALPMLDLFGTAIRSIQTQREDNAIRLKFTLDSDSRVQSQRLDKAEGTILIVDFQPAKRPRVAAARQATVAAAATMAKSKANKSPQFANASKRPTRPDLKNASRGRSPSTPHEMRISRSAGDRKRSDRDDARQSAERTVELAREAKESGDLEGAAQLYSAARKASPGHHEALVEGVDVLSELGRFDQALSLIGEARNAQPKNSVYLMVHAKLLAKNDLQSAITLLDESGLSVEAAPKVQALTAAYLQKNGQHDSAIERYESILRRYPNRPEVWMGLGISLEARGRTAEAIDVYRIAVQSGDLPGRSRGWISARIDALNQES